jgi:hypothetical protein
VPSVHQQVMLSVTADVRARALHRTAKRLFLYLLRCCDLNAPVYVHTGAL